MSIEMWNTILQILLGGLITLIPGVLAWITATNAAKRRAAIEAAKLPVDMKVLAGDAADKVSQGYDRLVEDLQDRLNNVETRLSREELKICEQARVIAEQEKRINFLETGVKKLVAQLKGLREVPVFDINGKISPEIPR